MYYTVCTERGPFMWVRSEAEGIRGYSAQGAIALSGPHANIEGCVRSNYSSPSLILKETSYQPGEYHPRIQREPRPSLSPPTPPMHEMYRKECRSSLMVARGLFARLEEVFQFVEPSEANFEAYGHELRSLLILACTEIESALKAILVANGIAPIHRQTYSLADYERLRSPMRLPDWKMTFHSFPELIPMTPFSNWTSGLAPTWWSDYNKVKHNREGELRRASLGAVLSAMAGVYAVIAAQFGVAALHMRGAFPLPPIELIATDDGFPNWTPDQFYVPPAVPGGHSDWTPVPLTFAATPT
jgi:hypothetical protein